MLTVEDLRNAPLVDDSPAETNRYGAFMIAGDAGNTIIFNKGLLEVVHAVDQMAEGRDTTVLGRSEKPAHYFDIPSTQHTYYFHVA